MSKNKNVVESLNDDNEILNGLLAEMTLESGADLMDEIIEPAVADIGSAMMGLSDEDEDEEITLSPEDEASMFAAVADIEKAEAVHALYQEQDGEVMPTSDKDAPKTTEADLDAPKAKGAKGKKKKADKKEGEPAKERLTYVTGKPSEVLSAKLGEKTGEILLLEVGDVELEPEALKAQQAELLALLDVRPNTENQPSTQKKVALKVVMLFTWLKNGGALNEVIKRTFEVLARDGEITTGDKGNLHAALLAKPYSPGTCRAQAGQMVSMLPMLKIATKSDKGRLVANPQSLILMKAKAELGLA